MIGECRGHGGNCVKVVAEIPGWMFVIPIPPSPPGRPYSIAIATWVELPFIPKTPAAVE